MADVQAKGFTSIVLLLFVFLCLPINSRGRQLTTTTNPTTFFVSRKIDIVGTQNPSPTINPTASTPPSPVSSPSVPTSTNPTPPPSPVSSPIPSIPTPANPPPPPSPPASLGNTFDVRDYGAKGDGVTDDTKAFQATWAAACNVEASKVVVVPLGFQFLVGPISFSGVNCKPDIVFQLDGTIIAPTSAAAWGSGTLHWLEFTKLRGITIQGQGTIEGRGSVWWGSSTGDDSTSNTENSGRMPHAKPTALRIYGSSNVIATGIMLKNSPQCHLKFDSCNAVEVSNVTVSSPADSPNTDGIHLQDSEDVSIHNTNLACGDDCVSIQTGCSNVRIHDVNCGPGHGISIGGLGKGNTQAVVSDVSVEDVSMVGTLTGVRIKTWQGGSGSVKNVMFSNVNVNGVETPIMIDQFYCDQKKACNNQTAAVALSDITYRNIKGTYTVEPVHLACSDSNPCSNIHLSDIQLMKAGSQTNDPFCWGAFGDLQGTIEPPITCLQHRTSINLNITIDIHL